MDAREAPGRTDPFRCFPPTGLLVGYPALLQDRAGTTTEAWVEECSGADPGATGREPPSNWKNARSQRGTTFSIDRRRIMKRTDVTYGQLDAVLRSLGFRCWFSKKEPPARGLPTRIRCPGHNSSLSHGRLRLRLALARSTKDRGTLRHCRTQSFRRQNPEGGVKALLFSAGSCAETPVVNRRAIAKMRDLKREARGLAINEET